MRYDKIILFKMRCGSHGTKIGVMIKGRYQTVFPLPPMARQWTDASAEERLAAKNDFLVPKHIRKEYLPQKTINFLDLVNFQLPNLNFSKASPSLQLDSFFSRDKPTVEGSEAVDQLWTISLPPHSIVRHLQNASREAWINGYQSVVLAHIPESTDLGEERYPMWVITLWEMILNHRSMERGPWVHVVGGLRALQKHRNPNLSSLANRTLSKLSTLPWKAPATGLDGNRPMCMLHPLLYHYHYHYLGPAWTSSAIIDDLLTMIR